MRQWTYRKAMILYGVLCFIPGCCFGTPSGYLVLTAGPTPTILVTAMPLVGFAFLLAWMTMWHKLPHPPIKRLVICSVCALLIVIWAVYQTFRPVYPAGEGIYYFRALMVWLADVFLGWFVLWSYPVLRKIITGART